MIYRGYAQQKVDFSTLVAVDKRKKGEVPRYIVCVLLVHGESVEDKLKTLNSCNCCERHKKNKPESLDSSIKKDSYVKDYELNMCSCDCRHLARLICYDPTVCDICSD